eukprot:s980_g20.t1
MCVCAHSRCSNKCAHMCTRIACVRQVDFAPKMSKVQLRSKHVPCPCISYVIRLIVRDVILAALGYCQSVAGVRLPFRVHGNGDVLPSYDAKKIQFLHCKLCPQGCEGDL